MWRLFSSPFDQLPAMCFVSILLLHWIFFQNFFPYTSIVWRKLFRSFPLYYISNIFETAWCLIGQDFSLSAPVEKGKNVWYVHRINPLQPTVLSPGYLHIWNPLTFWFRYKVLMLLSTERYIDINWRRNLSTQDVHFKLHLCWVWLLQHSRWWSNQLVLSIIRY